MEVIRYGSKRTALLALLLNDLDHLRGRGERVTDFPSKVQGVFPTWIPQPCSALFHLGKSRLRPGGDHLALMFCNRCKDMNGQPVRMGHIHGHKLDA
jgi:hypothetical protein